MLVPARSDAALAARTFRALSVASKPVETRLLVGITGVACVVRFATLGAQSYWFDEAQAAHELHLSLGSMLSSFNAVETAPPLYFVLGWVWVHLFGSGAVALRSLSALAGTALIPIVYLAGRELVSSRAGLVAAAFAAVNPFMVWYSQEAREYMLVAAFCAASLLWFARALKDPSRRNVVWWAVFSGLALLTHYFAGFLVAPEAVWLLYTARNRATKTAVAGLVVIQLALVPLLVAHATHSLLGFITETPLGIRLQAVPIAFALGPSFEGTLMSAGLIGGAILAALLGKDFYLERAVIAAWVPLAIVVAAACTTRLRISGAVLAAILLAGSAYGLIKINSDAAYQRPDWRGVASALGSPAGQRAIIAYDGRLAADPLSLYLRGVPWTQPTGPVSVHEVDVVGYPWQELGNPLPPGYKLIASKRVSDYLVDRFSVAQGLDLTPTAIGALGGKLLGPSPSQVAVLVQQVPSSPPV